MTSDPHPKKKEETKVFQPMHVTENGEKEKKSIAKEKHQRPHKRIISKNIPKNTHRHARVKAFYFNLFV